MVILAVNVAVCCIFGFDSACLGVAESHRNLTRRQQHQQLEKWQGPEMYTLVEKLYVQHQSHAVNCLLKWTTS